MTELDTFLKATDLDDLLRARHGLTLSPGDADRIRSIVDDWRDPQAVANLLFHPGVIPGDRRIAAIGRGLGSTEAPYFALAAVVGLQEIEPEAVPAETRAEWRHFILAMIQSEVPILAGRASVTLFSWFSEAEAAEVLSRYPVPDERASKNLRAFALSLFGGLAADDFARRIEQCGVAPEARAEFTDLHVDYVAKRSEDAFGADFMMSPVLGYIPNLSDVSTPPTKKPWWKFW